jgi:hypothetical protein
MFGSGLSGYKLTQLHPHFIWLWVVPVLAAANLAISSTTQHGLTYAANCVTGSVLLIGFFYLLYSTSTEIFRVLSIGAYLTLFSSAALSAYSLRLLVKRLPAKPKLSEDRRKRDPTSLV